MSKPETNYFYVNRELLNSRRWLSEPFSRGQAWIDLFGLAQHSRGFFRVRGIRVEVGRGQLAYSQLTLAKRWQWSRSKVKRFLNELETRQDIRQQNNTVTTVITVLNYDKWQGSDTTDDTTNEHQTNIKRTSNDTHKRRIKNDNNEKNDNNLSSEDKRLTDLLYSSVKQNYPFTKEKDYSKDYAEMNRLHRIDEWTYEQIEYIICWSQNDTFWRKNIRSVSTLRKQFETLAIRAKENTNQIIKT
ncbi:hypothetical protein KAU51_03975 [Candidatus Parcubacteria bacterium]|nr:hypothetical protein [Candidatus Parcubacteria bacterium]